MFVIGITGNMGSGKSTVTRLIGQKDIPVLSSDDIVNSLRSPGNVIWQHIKKRWPGRYIKDDRQLDTAKLGRDILKDQDFKKEIENFIHPLVKTEIKKILKVWEKEGYQVVAVEVPLLYEAGWQNIFDGIIVTHASEDILIDRITQKKGIDKKEAAQWLSNQMKQEEKVERADYKLNTSKDLKETKKEIESILKKIKGER